MQLQSSKKEYSFDFLEKIDYTSCLHGIFSRMELKLIEAKKKNPNVNFDEQEKIVKDLNKIYIWLSAMFEEKELIYRHNLNLERVNLELQSKVNELKKQIEVINKIDNL